MDNGRGDRDNRQDEWEALKLYFDFFKHFTTLTTASGLITLAISQAFHLEPRATVGVLTALAVPLALSLFGMANILMHAQEWGFWKFDFERDPGHLPLVLMGVTLVTFGAALLFVAAVLSPPAPPGACLFPALFC